MSDADFWASSFKRIKYLVERYVEEVTASYQPITQGSNITEISSMKDIVGWT